MKNILVLMPVEARHKEKIEAAAKDCSVVYSTPAQVTAEQVRKANIIFGLVVALLILCSGFIVKGIVKIKKAGGFEEDERTWDDLKK